jgi:hypothetical protein
MNSMSPNCVSHSDGTAKLVFPDDEGCKLFLPPDMDV